ncbi:MAG: hypothetical protein C0179_06635 [Fervidicoccus sp.]|nr:MAG: hypothetical protein C0179_06635 [Fervidicoccus sp.]
MEQEQIREEVKPRTVYMARILTPEKVFEIKPVEAKPPHTEPIKFTPPEVKTPRVEPRIEMGQAGSEKQMPPELKQELELRERERRVYESLERRVERKGGVVGVFLKDTLNIDEPDDYVAIDVSWSPDYADKYINVVFAGVRQIQGSEPGYSKQLVLRSRELNWFWNNKDWCRNPVASIRILAPPNEVVREIGSIKIKRNTSLENISVEEVKRVKLPSGYYRYEAIITSDTSKPFLVMIKIPEGMEPPLNTTIVNGYIKKHIHSGEKIVIGYSREPLNKITLTIRRPCEGEKTVQAPVEEE